MQKETMERALVGNEANFCFSSEKHTPAAQP